MSSMQMRGFFGVASALAMATAVFVSGCGDDDTVQPPDQFAAPSSLVFNNRADGVRLDWNLSSDESFDEMVGYNVYRDTAPMSGLSAGELVDKKLNANTLAKGTAFYIDNTAVLGTKYYYGVRSVRDNGNLSVSSNEIDTAIYQDGGLATVSEFASPSASGFSASLGRVFSFVAANADSIEFYLGTADDTGTGALLLKSPSTYSDQQPWNGRVAEFKLVESDDSSTSTTSGWSSTIELGTTAGQIEDKYIAVKLPRDFAGETHYGRLRIVEFQRTQPGDRAVQINWRYQPIPAYARF
ncbi:MAG: hypothetical protein H6682_19310 [Candidatus Eisenbacteria bacterium]|nr:hypothetical protein [Candidatus Eisenbacteria bacterium]